MRRGPASAAVPAGEPNLPGIAEYDAVMEDARAAQRRGFIALCGGLLFGLVGAGCVLYRIAVPGPAPIIAEVCRGDVLAVRTAESTPGRPRLEDIAEDLNAWVRGAREVSIDLEFLKRQAFRTYALTRQGSQAEAMLRAFHAANRPDERAKTETVKLDSQTALPARGDAGSNTWNLEWREIARLRDGTVRSVTWWKLEISFALRTPGTAEEVRQNPRGIYVEAYQWQSVPPPRQRVAEGGR